MLVPDRSHDCRPLFSAHSIRATRCGPRVLTTVRMKLNSPQLLSSRQRVCNSNQPNLSVLFSHTKKAEKIKKATVIGVGRAERIIIEQKRN